MKFFLFIQISNSHSLYWVNLYDVPSILLPFYVICCMYSKLRSQLPKSGDPNIFSLVEEILSEADVMCAPSSSLPDYLYLSRVDILCEYERGLYLPLLLRSEHFHCCIFEPTNHASVFEYHLVKHDNDTLLPILDERSTDLHCGSFFCILPYCKSNNLIETKAAAMKL